MSNTRLTKQQLKFFNSFGYLLFPGLLADCVERIIEEFERVWEEHGGGHHGKPHDEEQRSCIVPFPDQSEYLSSLLDDPRIHDIAAGILGDVQLYERRRQFLGRRHALALRWLRWQPHPEHQDCLLPRQGDEGRGRSARHSRQSPLR